MKKIQLHLFLICIAFVLISQLSIMRAYAIDVSCIHCESILFHLRELSSSKYKGMIIRYKLNDLQTNWEKAEKRVKLFGQKCEVLYSFRGARILKDIKIEYLSGDAEKHRKLYPLRKKGERTLFIIWKKDNNTIKDAHLIEVVPTGLIGKLVEALEYFSRKSSSKTPNDDEIRKTTRSILSSENEFLICNHLTWLERNYKYIQIKEKEPGHFVIKKFYREALIQLRGEFQTQICRKLILEGSDTFYHFESPFKLNSQGNYIIIDEVLSLFKHPEAAIGIFEGMYWLRNAREEGIRSVLRRIISKVNMYDWYKLKKGDIIVRIDKICVEIMKREK